MTTIEVLRERVFPILATLALGVIAGAGMVPLLSLGEDEPPDPNPSGTTAVTVAAEPPVSIVEVEITVPSVEVPDLNPAIGRVLRENGYVGMMDHAALEEQVDPAIVRVLENAGAVLVVIDEGVGE